MNVYKVRTTKSEYHVQAKDIKDAYTLVSNCMEGNASTQIRDILFICSLLDTEES